MTAAIDLFSGPRGWDVPGRELGIESVGIEFEENAVATSRAAGFETIHDDVRLWSPFKVRAAYPDLVFRGLIASPPCQTFSMAGKGAGRQALDLVLRCIERMARRERIDYREFSDERTGLVLEPLRWALRALDDGLPFEWLAFEQVPAVLPVWEAMAAVLDDEGYSVAVGKLSAEEYGVPQTRKRAILLANSAREVALPKPTHRAYRKGLPQSAGDQSLLPWVSMADALCLTRPAVMVSNYGTGGDASNRGTRLSSEPAPTVTSKINRNRWRYQSNQKPGGSDDYLVRSLDEPAPTITGTSRSARLADAEVDGNVTEHQATVLQTFPANHPWQGGRVERFQQIGNAIPCLLAGATLSAATGVQV